MGAVAGWEAALRAHVPAEGWEWHITPVIWNEDGMTQYLQVMVMRTADQVYSAVGMSHADLARQPGAAQWDARVDFDVMVQHMVFNVNAHVVQAA